MEKKARVHPECINASNPYHECVDYCYRKIVEAKALDAEKLDEDQASAKDPEERTVHPDCINASNPYHECSEFCFRRIAEIKDRTAGDEQGFIEMVRGKEKNTSKKDPAWKYSTQVDVGDGDKTYIYLKCNFYEKIVKGSVTRRKQHLSCSHKNVTPCAKVPEEPREELCLYMKKATVSKHFARQQFDDRVDDGSYYGSGRSAKDFSTLPSTPPHSSRGARGPINQHMANLEDYKNEAVRGASQTAPENARDARRRVCMDIGRFFFENGISFSAATSSAYFDMIHSVGSYGRRLRPPSMYELRTWILKEELTSTEKTIEEIKRTWPHTGVTLMFDGWSDMKNKSLINILINNPYGTIFLKSFDASDKVKDATYIFDLLDSVIEEIGESLVVQVVTDNGSDYKTAGIKLMEKRKHMYWTPCVAHCIDLILEKFGNLPQHKNALNKAKKISKFIYNHSWVLALMRKFSKNELIRPTVTRFATAYLTLQSILDARKPLEAMFTSKEWLNCAWARKSEGKEVRKIILNSRFWVSVTYAITTTRPLVQVLRMVDTDRKPSMGFIYNSMDEAKKQIAKNLGGEEASYRKIWDIIDEKWEVQFHRHLYAAGYYLNPQFQYAKNKSTNPEIKLSLYHCMDRLIEDPFERARADLQLVTFRNKEQFFGLQQAKYTITKRSPVEWWIQFGDETPDLQRFAMKVLGLTCSSSGCERNWSAYNQIYSKRRNRLSTLRMNSLAYILYNKRLNDRHLKKTVVETGEDPLVCNDVLSDDEWFVDDANEVSPAELQEEDLNVDFFEGGKEKATTSRSTTTQQEITRKGKRKMIEVEEEEADWENIESTKNEARDKDIHYDNDSNEDPLSEDSAEDF